MAAEAPFVDRLLEAGDPTTVAALDDVLVFLQGSGTPASSVLRLAAAWQVKPAARSAPVAVFVDALVLEAKRRWAPSSLDRVAARVRTVAAMFAVGDEWCFGRELLEEVLGVLQLWLGTVDASGPLAPDRLPIAEMPNAALDKLCDLISLQFDSGVGAPRSVEDTREDRRELVMEAVSAAAKDTEAALIDIAFSPGAARGALTGRARAV